MKPRGGNQDGVCRQKRTKCNAADESRKRFEKKGGGTQTKPTPGHKRAGKSMRRTGSWNPPGIAGRYVEGDGAIERKIEGRRGCRRDVVREMV